MQPVRRGLMTLLVILTTVTTAATQELLVHYTFDELSGDALDTGSAPPANGVLRADATRTTDTPGRASPRALDVSAEGLETRVVAGDPAKIDTLSSFTMTTWLKLLELNSVEGGSGNVRLLAKQAPGPIYEGFSWNLNDPNNGDRGIDNFRLGMFVGGEFGFSFGQSTEDVGAEEWTFLAATYDGTDDLDNLRFYRGDEATAVTELGDPLSLNSGPMASSAGVAEFGIGFSDAAPEFDFAAVGFQDDIRVYRGVLDLDQLEAVRLENLGTGPTLEAGDADQDLDFDQFDLILVQQAAKYLTGQPATWGEGDWDGAPGGQQGSPPQGNGLFDQLDIIASLNAGVYLKGPYAALQAGGVAADAQTSIGYNAKTGEVWVDAPAGMELTSVNIDSKSGIFTGDPAQNLGGSFDNDADDNIFRATFGSSFGTVSFGTVALSGLSHDSILDDLQVVGSLAGGGGLGDVDLIYVPIPEPASMVLAYFGLLGVMGIRHRKSMLHEPGLPLARSSSGHRVGPLPLA